MENKKGLFRFIGVFVILLILLISCYFIRLLFLGETINILYDNFGINTAHITELVGDIVIGVSIIISTSIFSLVRLLESISSNDSK